MREMCCVLREPGREKFTQHATRGYLQSKRHDPHGAFADGIAGQGGKMAVHLVNTVSRQLTAALTSGIEKVAGGVKAKGARRGFGGLLAQSR